MYLITKFLQKMLLAIFVTSFLFVSVYVPQTYQETPKAEATFWNALEPTQWLNNISLLIENSYSVITEYFQSQDWIKEYALDGLAWGIAKATVSQMSQTIVAWINSGFRGSPAFVQDFEGFMFDVADYEIGKYIQNIDSLGSFICSPFKLDIQISLATSFSARGGNIGGRPAGSCTLTGVMENLENFIDGDFASGGWNAWFNVTNSPQIYTPTGAELAARAELRTNIANAQGQEKTLLDFGGGFLSKKDCTTVPASVEGGASTENCKVVTPGTTISESLNRHLSYGGEALIEADEIDEIIGALFAQLAQRAITGGAGLLGLSGGSGSNNSQYLNSINQGNVSGGGTPPTGSYLGDLGNEGSQQNLDRVRGLITTQIALEERYLAAAEENLPLLIAFSVDPNYEDEDRKALAINAANEIEALIPEIEEIIEALQRLLTSLNGVSNASQVVGQFTRLEKHSAGKVDADITRWRQLLVPPTYASATSTPPVNDGEGGG